MAGELGISIAAATSGEDLEAVRGLFRAYAASLDVDLAYQNFEAELAALPGAYAPPGGVLLLARERDGTPVGCVGLRPMATQGCCEMKRLYVAPAGRGTGLGRRLVEALAAIAAGNGYSEMRLDTLPSMTVAQALYESCGFEPMSAYYDTPVAGTRFLRRPLAVLRPD